MQHENFYKYSMIKDLKPVNHQGVELIINIIESNILDDMWFVTKLKIM